MEIRMHNRCAWVNQQLYRVFEVLLPGGVGRRYLLALVTVPVPDDRGMTGAECLIDEWDYAILDMREAVP